MVNNDTNMLKRGGTKKANRHLPEMPEKKDGGIKVLNSFSVTIK